MKKTELKSSRKNIVVKAVALSALALFSPSITLARPVLSPAPTAAASGQEQVTGVVKDSKGEPIIGASVKIAGTTLGVATDINGKFTLNAPAGSKLVITSIGYKTVTAAAGSDLNITMADDSQMLDEVVAIGYGAQAKKKDLSASVGVISNPTELAVRPVASTEGMMQGQIPGVTIESNGGDPTAAPSVVIRGQGSRNGDNVLWVVDGVPGAPIASLDDIESIVVLKDAASAAIYGAQSGAGGVILVTTKKAKEGNTTLSYSGTFGVRKAYNLPRGLTAEEEIQMRTTSYANAGLTLPDGWNTAKNPWVATTRTNWMDEVFRTAMYQRHNVALNMGTANFANRISFNYDKDNGVLRDTYNKNLALHYDGKYQLNKWVSVSENFTWKNNENRTGNTSSPYNGVIMNALYMPSSATVYSEFTPGGYGGTTTEDPAYIAQYGSNFADIHGDAINPVRLLEAYNEYNRTSDTWTTTSLEVGNVVPGLKFVSRFTYNVTNYNDKTFVPKREEVGKPYLTNEYTNYNYRTDRWKTENTLTYDNTFGQHTVGLLASTTADHYATRGLNVDAKDFSDESKFLQYLAWAGSQSASDYLTGPDANVSLIGRAAYSYADRYFLTASFRRDYAGRLPKKHNHGDFPAFTAAWKISNEAFFPQNDIVTLLKLRGSWGRIGNLGSIGYNYKSAVLSYGVTTEKALYGTSGTLWGTRVWNSDAVNPKLTWETSEQFDLGLDINMLSDRLAMTLDWFEKKTYNLIQTQTMYWPSTIGVDAMLVNQGSVRNRGIEVAASWRDKVGNDISYWVNGNFAWLKNWVKSTGVTDSEGNPGVWTGDGSWRMIPYVYQTAQGEPLNSFYLIKSLGIFQSDEEAANYKDANGKRIQPNAVAGDLKFEDKNGDGKISDADRQYCGNATPKWTYAFGGGITWKDLTVSVMFQGVGKAQALNVAKSMTVGDVEGNFNRSAEILKAWSPTNTGSDIPRLSKNDPNGNFSTASTWFLEDASYFRLKNFTINYDITKLIRKWQHLNDRSSRMSVFFSGDNVFTVTNYTGIDPECGGYDTMKYPVSRAFSFGVRLTY